MGFYYISGFFFTIYALLRHRCQLIHVHWAIPTGLIGALVGTIFKKPVIVTIHGSDFRLAMERASILRRIFLYVCKKAKHIHCVSERMKGEIERFGIDKGKILTFPMGIDENFLSERRDQDENLNHRCFTILSNRNLLSIYNISLLIRAIPIILKEDLKVRFLIAGEGPERENLEKEAENLKVSKYVQFLGRIQHEEMPNLLNQTDIYVSTSLHDGASVSLLEALASGVFPVATDIPSNREWISDGENGFLVPIDEEKVLAERIVEAIRNRTLLERSKYENLSIIKKKALWPVTMERVKGIYKTALDSRS
jgi:glycosyltransferase involved in cell wall biosynthesis